jgi:hypothetical protein
MDKVKEALHIGSSRKNKTGEDNTAAAAALAREDIANGMSQYPPSHHVL